jgi:hypothetical protein
MGQVIDHAMLDRDGHRAGRVDDLSFELVTQGSENASPKLVLRAIVSGPVPRAMPNWLRVVARACYRIIGVKDAAPVSIDWSHVSAIDAFVHLDVERGPAGLRVVDEAALRLVEKLPGSSKERG